MSMRNMKALVGALLAILIGGLLALTGYDGFNGFLTGVGCSLIASGAVSILNAVYIERREIKSADVWGLDKIYKTRSEKNADSDPKLKSVTDRVDGIAFGLGSFRRNHTEQVEDCLKRGVNFRFITMNPDSEYAIQRDREEGVNEGSTAHSINQLVEWAKTLNGKNYKGQISIKGYSCMTLDFYWRVDDELYMGPYWYGYLSQQTVTYKYVKGGEGFDLYQEYFSRLWDNDKLMKRLV